MKDFPEFMKHPANRIASQTQHTLDIEGYVFDGADGSQMAFWTSRESRKTDEHVHEYDEYFVVGQGQYTLIIEGKRIPVKAGEEYYIPKGTPHGGENVAGTRTIHAFGGKRARRESEEKAWKASSTASRIYLRNWGTWPKKVKNSSAPESLR